MTYQDIIQKTGKQILKSVYYYNNNNEVVNVSNDNFEEAKISFKANLVGTVMYELDLTLKEKIETNKGIYLNITATYSNESQSKLYGPFYLKECEYVASDKTYIHTCYDNILNAMVDYKPISISYPTTLQKFYNKLVETLGYTSSVSLINGTQQLTNDIYNGINYTYRSVLQDIAEANGILLYLDGTQLKQATLGSSEEQATINDDILKNTNIEFGNHYGPINVIALSRSGDSDIIRYPEILPNAINEFKIQDNQLLNDNNRSNYLIGIYTKLANIEYDIYDTELIGYGGFNPLQKIIFTTGGKTYESYAFNNEITITSGYNENIYTDEPSESTTDYKYTDTTDKKINQTYLIVDKQNQQIDAVVSQVDEQDEKIASISLTVDELNSKISDVANITVEKQSEYGSVQLDNVNTSEPVYIRVYPINQNISYSYPNNKSFPTDDYDGIRILRFTNTKTNKIIYDYEIPNDLLYYDEETYDDFILDYEKETCTINQRCEYNANGEVVKKTTTTTLTYPYPTIELTDGNYKVELLTYNSGYLNVRLMATNIYTTQFYTKVETDSKISQAKNSIELEVSETYTNKKDSEKLQSQITINKDNITSEVSRAKNAETTLGSRITQTESNISSEVENRESADNTLSSRITQNANSITSEISNRQNGDSALSTLISQTDARITTEVSDRTSSDNSLQSKIDQTAHTIDLSVGTSSGKSTGISISLLDKNGRVINSDNGTITLSGDVIVKSNLTDGTTQISGNNIKTGTIDASRLNVNGVINAINGDTTTTINGGKITSNSISSNQVAADIITTSNFSAQNINASKITSGTMSANRISGGTIDATNINVKNLTATNINRGSLSGIAYSYASSSNGRVNLGNADDGVVMGYTSGGGKRWSLASFTAGGRFQTFNSSGVMAAYFNQSGAHSSSDIRLKENIKNIDKQTSLKIINNLDPIEYTYKNTDGYHRGLSAQQVVSVLKDNNIENQIYETNNEYYSLNYTEFIPDLINCIKIQQEQITELKNEIQKNKGE